MLITTFPREVIGIIAQSCDTRALIHLGLTCHALNLLVGYPLYARNRANAAEWAATACFAVDEEKRRVAFTVLQRCVFKEVTRDDNEYSLLLALVAHYAGLPEDPKIWDDRIAIMNEIRYDSRIKFSDTNYLMPIIVAAKFNAYALIEHILPQDNAASNALDWALQAACASSKLEAVRVLLAAGANPNVFTSGGSSWTFGSVIMGMDEHSLCPIENAAMGVYTGNATTETDEIIRLLLKKDAQPTPRSLIFAATLQSSIDIAKALFEAGYSLNFWTRNKCTPLMAAVSAKNSKLVRYLLEIDHVDASLASSAGWTPLIMATYIGCKNIFSDLVAGSRELINVADENGRTPMMYAVLLGHTSIAMDLTEKYEADLSRKDQWGNTALLLAVRAGLTAVLPKMLARLLKDVATDTNNLGRSVFYYAACSGNEDMVQTLTDGLQLGFEQYGWGKPVGTIDRYCHECQVCSKIFICQESECQELDNHCRDNTNHIWEPSICQTPRADFNFEGSGKRMNRAFCNYNKSDRLEPESD